MATISGGSKLEAALAKLAAKVAKPATLRVGFLEGKSYPETGMSLPLTAALNEFGHTDPNTGAVTPPRPFMRNTVRSNSPSWPATLAKLLQANDFDAVKSLRLMGEGSRGLYVASVWGVFVEGVTALLESTVERLQFRRVLFNARG